MRLNLTLHCGSHAIERDQLEEVATPPPTDTWQPIPHSLLIEEVETALARKGLRVLAQAHGITRGGKNYFGMLQLANGEVLSDYGLVVGLRNSNSKDFPAGLACGAGVFVCDNLSFSSEVVLARKHTSKIREALPRLVEEAIGKLGSLRVAQEQRFAAYQTFAVSDLGAHDLMIRAVQTQVLPVLRLPRVMEQWHSSDHPEFRSRTAWSLFNAFTEAMKGGCLETLPRRTEVLHGLVDGLVGLGTITRPPAAEPEPLAIAF